MDTTLINEWATKIAQEVAPDEVYQAQFIAREFIRGGRDRKKLFKQGKGGEVGGSGLGEITILLPYILQALAVSAPIIYSILANGAINNGIDLIKEAKNAYDKLKKANTKEQHKEQNKQSEQIQVLINEARQSMTTAMIPSGVNKEELEEHSQRVMLLIFEKPEDAAHFIAALKGKNREG